MKTKNFAVRLTETINFIETSPTPLNFRGDKAVVVQDLRTWNTQTPLLTRQTISNLMSQDGTTHRPGDPTQRKYRRASLLLRCVYLEPQIRWATARTQVNSRTGAQARGEYELYLENSRDEVYNKPANAMLEIQNLTLQPKRLLQRWALEVNGTGNSGIETYRVRFDGGKLKLDCNGILPNTFSFDAVNVPATPYIQVKDALDDLDPTTSRGTNCDVMLTTQFTGCTYCFQKRKGELLAAHIDPNATGKGTRLEEKKGKGHTGEQISAELRDQGEFSVKSGEPFHAYGRNLAGYGYGLVSRVIIVAVKKDDAWRVYAQLQHPDGSFTVERIDV